ncbi:MAG: T9SS type A sorting domain-containing protein [Cytophagales bacterium]
MKKLLLITFSLLTFNFSLFTFHYSFSQSFGQLGSEWYFDGNHGGPCPQVCSYVHVQSVSDSIINGKTCHKLIANHTWHNNISNTYTYPSMFVYEESDTVFMWSPVNQKFLVTYIFNVNTGDSIVLDYPSFLENSQATDTTYNMVIDSVTQQNLDGQLLNKYYFHSDLLFGTHYMDRIGSFFWFYPRFVIILEAGAGLRCYSDSQIDTSLVSYPCDSLWNLFSVIENLELANEIRLFPNPASAQLNISIPNFSFQTFNVQLFDLQGNLRIRTQITKESQTLDVSDLKSGMYIYEIESEGQFYRNKLIIE